MIETPAPLKHHASLLAALATALLGSSSLAATIRVAPNSSGRPLATAVAAAAVGDTLVLAPGVYSENFRIEKTLTLRGEAGAILDGTAPVPGPWVAAKDLPHVYVLPARKKPSGLLIDGKFIAAIRFDRAQAEGPWHWRSLFAQGTPLSGFEQIRAIWMYHPEEQQIYLRVDGGSAPEPARVRFVAASAPLIDVVASGVTIEGLTLRGGRDAIRLGRGASECVVRGCTITSYEDTGVYLTDGATHCTVEECQITRGAWEEWRATTEKPKENYEIWRVHKEVGNYDRVGIDLVRAGIGNRILRNRLDRTFDGICMGDSSAESLDKPLPNPDHGRGTEIAYNTIENTRDSGIELGVGCIDVNVHHNTLRHTHGGLRFKLPRIGPVFIHHNHLVDGAPFNIWFSMDASPAEGYIYHNTIEGGDDAALVYSSFSRKRDAATPKWHVLNNLVLHVEDGFFAQRKGTPARDFTESHNLSTSDPKAAIDAGIDLSSYRQGRPLPGCEPGYFRGAAPDAGAVEQ